MVGVQTTMTRKNYLGQTVIGNDNAWYSSAYSNINKVEENETNKELLDSYRTYTEMVEKADAITKDMDARYEAFADAEAYTLEKHICSHVTTTLAGA